jgi:hypothetical protein
MSLPRRKFKPEWVVHPGATLVEALEERSMTQAHLARLSGLSAKRLLVSDDLLAVLRSFDVGRRGTHAPDCWKYHPRCAIRVAADRIEQLEAEPTVHLFVTDGTVKAIGEPEAVAGVQAVIAERDRLKAQVAALLAAGNQMCAVLNFAGDDPSLVADWRDAAAAVVEAER